MHSNNVFLTDNIRDILNEYSIEDVLAVLAAEINHLSTEKFKDVDFNGPDGIASENELRELHRNVEKMTTQLEKAVFPQPSPWVPVGRWKIYLNSRAHHQTRLCDDLEGHWGELHAPDLSEPIRLGREALGKPLHGVTVEELIEFSVRNHIAPKEAEWKDIKLTAAMIVTFREVMKMTEALLPSVTAGRMASAWINSTAFSKASEKTNANQLVRLGVLEKIPASGNAWKVLWNPAFCEKYAPPKVFQTIMSVAREYDIPV
jgi:hypothetical protein